MGQGIYTMIGYGALKPQLPTDINGFECELATIFGDNLASLLKRSNECDPSYLLVPIACSDAMLAREWHIELLARRSFILSDLRLEFGQQIRDAKSTWNQVVDVIKKKSNEMPCYLAPGDLLIVSDYD